MTMDEKTIKATQGAWRKWDKIARGKATNQGSDDCPLCALFLRSDCVGCPIADATGEIDCRDTPFQTYQWLALTEGEASSPARQAALVFRNFINLLLPSKHRMPKRRAKP